jgi:hypothetical protein
VLFGVDDSEARRAEQRLRDDKLALAEARRALYEQSRRTLTRPSTLALLVVVRRPLGRTARARRRRRAKTARRLGARRHPAFDLGAAVQGGVTAVAVEARRTRHHDESEPASRRHDQRPASLQLRDARAVARQFVLLPTGGTGRLAHNHKEIGHVEERS